MIQIDAIIRITLTSICGSDIHLVHGHIPTTPGYVLGHEYVGVVEEVGKSVKSIKVGQRVAGPAAPYCGHCTNCKAGHIEHCLYGGVHGSDAEFGNPSGAHSEFIRVPFAHNVLLPIPDLLLMIQIGKIHLSPIITHRMQLDDIEKAFELFQNRKENVIKIAIKP
ncbi:alcohol dehydrogenase catalytic domain-containing protein [Clostridiaceae bacterium 35-E11]